ncbi:BMP family ABC transporter substrate-binding protein [Cellulomonas fimi]|uniref:BMP family ABC transporter substrate-binding protein n=1 Tax=Cellulomonas fimi TaxID=1708 RepID=UPI002892FC14|nr:BMP family ABC transporter substrate-binding protein [Cellulomonas fimi]
MTTKKSNLAAGALGLAVLLAGCGGGASGDDRTAGASAGDGPTFIYVTNTPIGINKFLELGKVGTEAAAEEFDGTAKIYESTDDQSRRSNLEAAIAEQPDVIVLITFDFEDMAKEYAERNPEQQFLIVDACPADGPENLRCAVFREQEASYLVGVEAGMLSESGKVGSVMALDIPFLHRYSDSFAAGAQSVDSAIDDSQLAIGGSNPFADPAKGKEQALSMAATGVDQIFAVASGSNGGVFEAAAEQGIYGYGVDINQCPMAPGYVVDNTMKAVDVLVVSEIGKILDGKAERVTSYGLAEGGMDLTSLMEGAETSQCVVMEYPEVIERVKQVKQDIIDGKIELPDPAAS